MFFGLITTRIYKRLKHLYKYYKEFYILKDALEFTSDLGLVRVRMVTDWSYINDYHLSYANYAGTTVFEITANEDNTRVTPLLHPDKLSGRAVDLALLELETYLYNTHGDIDKYLENKAVEAAQNYRFHLDELKILEEGV